MNKVTVNFIDEAWAAVESAKAATGDTATDTINRAVQLYDFVTREMAAGAQMLMRYPDGSTQKVKLSQETAGSGARREEQHS